MIFNPFDVFSSPVDRALRSFTDSIITLERVAVKEWARAEEVTEQAVQLTTQAGDHRKESLRAGKIATKIRKLTEE